jgi:fructokinase
MSILLFGEIVWDDITENGGSGKPERLGGAPMNVAAHCARLGVPAQMCSALDQDALGKMALEQVCALGVGTDLVNIVSQETCLIKVSFGENGEPSYHIPEDVSWDHISIDAGQLERVRDCSCLYYGTLATRSPESRRTLEDLLGHGHFSRVYCDVNMRQPFYNAETIEFSLRSCHIAKLNIDELLEIGGPFSLDADKLERQMRRIADHFEISQLIVTLGENGAAYLDSGIFGQVPGIPVQVSDTVGAGDGFSAGAIACLERGLSLKEACAYGNRLGAFIAEQTGSIPDYSRKEFENWRRKNV